MSPELIPPANSNAIAESIPPANLLEPLPGFAVPNNTLQSIPLPVEFLAAVDEAQKANRVKSFLPKFFNPLFRKQGVVNKLSLQALTKVGESLQRLSEEIGARDRLIEKLTEHINTQTSLNQQHHGRILQFCQQLEGHLNNVSAAAQSTDTHILGRTETLQAEINSLVSAIQIDETSLLHLQSNAAAMEAKTTALDALQRQFKTEVANLQTNLSGLASLTDSLDARLADTADQLRTANQADLAASQVAQATDQRLASIQTALAALQQQAARQESQSTLLAEQLAALKAGQDSALAQLTQAQADAQQQAQSAVNTLRADLEQHLAAVEVRHQAEIARLVQTQAESFQQLSTRQDPIAARLRSDLEQHLAAVEARHQAEIAQIARTQAESFQQLSTRPDPTAARLRSDLEQHLAAVEVRHQAEIAQVARTQAELTQQIQLRAGTSPSAHELAELRNELTELRSELTILHQNHRGFLDRWETAVAKSVKSLPARRSNSGLPDKTSQHLAREKQREFDALYLAFENRFRGSREMIKERLKVNLEILARTSSRALSAPGARWPNRPDAPSYTIVDLGCGRGEWLEVVAQQGQRALGVDLNTYFIAECREHGLAIAESDAITFLRSLPNSCLALVTGFHIIEHLPLPLLLELISETHRVLVKGGTALFETPNCKNLTVGAANFYCDPTHQHPVFPETAQFLLKYAGFTEAKIDYRLPASGSPFDQSKPDQSALHGWFYGPQDYAVIAIK